MYEQMDNKYTWLCIASIFLVQLGNILAEKFHLEAEDYVIVEDNVSLETFHFPDQMESTAVTGNHVLKFQFCLPHQSNISFDRICIRSNEKLIHLHLAINNKYITKLDLSKFEQTTSNCPCVTIRSILNLSPGRHVMTIRKGDIKETGNFSVDSFTMTFPTTDLTTNILQCSIVCSEHMKFPKYDASIIHVRKLISGKIKNHSYRTKCAEVDNINIPLYPTHAKKLKITAIHPSYKTFENLKHHNFENCKQIEPVLFKLNNFRLGQKFSIKNRFVLTEGRYLTRRTILLQFFLEGPMNDAVDSEIGSDIHLSISPTTPDIEIIFSYFGRESRWIGTSPVKFSVKKLMHTWSVPDFTWSSVSMNFISFILPENLKTDLIIDNLSIVRRQIIQDVPFNMFQDERMILEGVDKDFWWLESEGKMRVKVVETNEVFTAADYIRIYVPIPWNAQNWCQIFVLYQDGNVRILPMTPPGLDWIPFGSSVIIGESNPIVRRPHAPIRNIDVYTKLLKLDIVYYDGNTASMHLNPSMFDTSINVTNIHFRKQPEMPALTFRSMYITEGNADCDHVNVDGKYDVKVLSDWAEISGNAFFFHRKCVSKHNTQSPDYLVEIEE